MNTSKWIIRIAVVLLVIFSMSSNSYSNERTLRYKMKSIPSEPAIALLEYESNGENRLIETVPNAYIEAIPYFVDYLYRNIDKYMGELQAEEMACLVISYSYPDNIEVNILSDKVDKYIKKVDPDKYLHELRIRSAMMMVNFVPSNDKLNDDGIDSNLFVGFQLFSPEIDYSNLDISPDYKLSRGSWRVVWEVIIDIKTEIVVTAKGTVTRTIKTIRKKLEKTSKVFNIITKAFQKIFKVLIKTFKEIEEVLSPVKP